MDNYGNAFRIIRLVKDIDIKEAAEGLGLDERSLRDIEKGKTALVTGRFEQMLTFYHVDYQIIFELAKEKASLQNVVHEAHKNGIVVHQQSEYSAGYEKRIEQMETKLIGIEQQLKLLVELLGQIYKGK